VLVSAADRRLTGVKSTKVLVAEAHDHLKLLENIYHLLKNHCDVSFYVNRSVLKEWSSIFPSANQTTVIVNELHSSTFFLWLLFHARRFDYVNISTGPEGNHFSDSINIVCFYLCCILYGKKIVLTVRRVKPYIRSGGGLFSYVRSRGIKHLNRFTFETRTVRDVFREYTDRKSCYLGVSYDRYTDLCGTKMCAARSRLPGGTIRIGLLGMVNPERREYGIITSALGGLSSEERLRMVFVTLGGCCGDRNKRVIEGLAKYVKVDCVDGILSAEQFDERGSGCDILISPLNRDYGTFNGSGSFGDAIYLRKKIILPSYVDKNGEFKEIAVYYETAEDLQEIFREIGQVSRIAADPIYYDQFTTRTVFKVLVDDLGFCNQENACSSWKCAAR